MTKLIGGGDNSGWLSGMNNTKRPSGYYKFSSDKNRIFGQIVYTQDVSFSQIAVVVGQNIVSIVEASKQPDSDLNNRQFVFSWSIPSLLKMRFAPLSVVDLITGERLDGPTEIVGLNSSSPPIANWVGEPPCWPKGLAGSLDVLLNEVVGGLWIDVDPIAVAARFSRNGPPIRASGVGWSVRAVAENEVQWIIHQSLPALLADMGVDPIVRTWIKLSSATSNFTQRHCEIYLTYWDGERFKNIRRLWRGRILRKFSFVDLNILCDLEEQSLAKRGYLSISIFVQPCSGVVVCQPVLAGSLTEALGFEDGRLVSSFGDVEQLTRVLDEPKGRELLLKGERHLCDPIIKSETAPHTEIIVPVYNGDDIVYRCLESLKCNTDCSFSVLIIDDGSREYTSVLLNNFASGDSRFKYYRRSINRGYTKTINEAIKITTSDWLVILNSDTVVSNGWLRKLHAAARAVPDAGLVGPLSNAATWQSVPHAKNADGSWSQNAFISPDLIDNIQNIIEKTSDRSYPEMPILNGFCTLISRSVFDVCGLFDEEAFPQGYGEETDMCLRAGLAGFKLIVADDCFVYHEKSVSFGSEARSKLTRAGGFELKNKHPGINIAAIERLMQYNPSMLRLRSKLSNLEAELRG